MNDKLPALSDALDLMYDEAAEEYKLPANIESNVPVLSEEEVERLEHEKEDYDSARQIYKTVADKGLKSLDLLTIVAEATQEPRAFEVIATLIKSLNETAKQMREIHTVGKPVSKLATEKQKDDDPKSINVDKAVFVGSPAELLKAMNDANKN